jgi:hypothetical protein
LRRIDLSLAAFLAVIGACLIGLGSAWLPLTPSHEELIAYAGKWAWMKERWSQGNFPAWWVGDFLGGFSGVAMLSYAASLLPYGLVSFFLPEVEAFKVGGLLLLGLGALAARSFGCEFTRCRWTGSLIGLLYFASPQLLMRLGWQEHMTIVTTFPLIPLTFWALLRLSKTGSARDALLLAMAFAATLLCWSKMGATLAVPLAGFALWLFFSQRECRPNLLKGARWAVPAVLLLGVLPLLPLLREFRFMTVFELGPFTGWQAMYSAKSAVSWLDRGGVFLQNLPPMLNVDRGGYYLGFLPLLAVVGVIAMTWKNRPQTPAGFRVMVALTLLVFWLSFGLRSVIQGHFELMSGAFQLPDWSISIPWFALIAPGVFLWWAIDPSRWKAAIFSVLVFAYYLIPGFVWIEKIPLFANLRAPDSFWILNGPFLWAVAGGIAIGFCIKQVRMRWIRVSASAAVCVLVLWDASGSARGFFANGLPNALFRDFENATEFLREAKVPGRVLPISGRYFYLGIPAHAHRALSTEAAHHNFMLRDTAVLEAAKFHSLTALQTYLTVAGVSHVLIDRNDVGLTPETEAWFSSWMEKPFENPHFTIYENPAALFPAFFSSNATRASNATPENALAAAAIGIVFINDQEAAEVLERPEEVGSINDFQRIEMVHASPGSFEATLDREAGILVLNQAWHPDWAATVNGVPVPIEKAAGAFPAVETNAGKSEVAFTFSPPVWYGISMFGGAAAWILALVAVLALSLRSFRAARRRHNAEGPSEK